MKDQLSKARLYKEAHALLEKATALLLKARAKHEAHATLKKAA